MLWLADRRVTEHLLVFSRELTGVRRDYIHSGKQCVTMLLIYSLILLSAGSVASRNSIY